MALAAGAHALVRGDGCVTNDHLDARQRNAKFFGDELVLDRAETLTEVAFAGVGGDGFIGGNGDPGVDLIGGVGCLCLSLLTEADDERAMDETAAGDRFGGRHAFTSLA